MVSKQAQALISIYDTASNASGWDYSLDVCVNYVQAHGANLLFHENDKHSNWRGALHSASSVSYTHLTLPTTPYV